MKVSVFKLSDGSEIIGEIISESDYIINLKDPLFLSSPENLDRMSEVAFYSKEGKFRLYTNSIVGDYTPTDSLVDYYYYILSLSLHKDLNKGIEKIIELQKKVIGEVSKKYEDAKKKLEEEKPEEVKNPKIMDMNDILTKVREKDKNKLN